MIASVPSSDKYLNFFLMCLRKNQENPKSSGQLELMVFISFIISIFYIKFRKSLLKGKETLGILLAKLKFFGKTEKGYKTGFLKPSINACERVACTVFYPMTKKMNHFKNLKGLFQKWGYFILL